MAKRNILLKRNTKSVSAGNTWRSPSVEDIQKRAYYIWEKKGRPENSDLDNWLEAEKSLAKT
jgi:hypothetical protein